MAFVQRFESRGLGCGFEVFLFPRSKAGAVFKTTAQTQHVGPARVVDVVPDWPTYHPPMPEPHHVAVELDRVVEAARAAGDQWREFLRAGMFSAGVYRLSAGEIDPQTPHAEDEIYYVLAGRAELEVEGKRQSVEPGSIAFVN